MLQFSAFSQNAAAVDVDGCYWELADLILWKVLIGLGYNASKNKKIEK